MALIYCGFVAITFGVQHLVYHNLSGTTPSLSGTPLSLSGTPPVSGIPPYDWNPTPVWNPTTYLEPYPIPCLAFHPECPTPSSCPQYPTPSGHCCSYLASNCPLPLIWPLPAHHLELLLHATPLPPATPI